MLLPLLLRAARLPSAAERTGEGGVAADVWPGSGGPRHAGADPRSLRGVEEGTPDVQEAVDALDAVLQSRAFANAPRCRELLSFVTTESLAGRGHLLNERVIARSALGRPATIDTRTDSAARVQARRTRDLLARYYAEEGAGAHLRIVLPKGQYAVVFRREAPMIGLPPVIPIAEPLMTTGPTLAVVQLRHRAGGIDRRVAVGLTESLVHVLSGFTGLRVVGPLVGDGADDSTYDVIRAGERAGARAVLHGAVWASEDVVRVSMHVTDVVEGRVLWSEKLTNPIDAFTGFGAEDEIVRRVAGAVGDVRGVVLRAPNRPVPTTGDPFVADALWRWFAFLDQLDPSTLVEVRDDLHLALEREPENPLVLASLAWAYTMDHLIPGEDASESLAAAEDLAARSLRIDPTSAAAYNVLAIVDVARGLDARAAVHAERALERAPDHPAHAFVAGVVLANTGEWDRGIRIMRDSIHLNPHGLTYRHLLPAVDALMHDDIARALADASLLDISALVWGPLLRAVCLDALGLESQASDELAMALLFEPDLLERPFEVLSVHPNVPTVAAEHVAARLASFGAAGTS